MKTIRSKQICEYLKIKDADEARKILSAAFNMLAWLNTGDKVELTDIKLEKISSDLIFIDSKLDLKQMVDSLEKKKILKFPV